MEQDINENIKILEESIIQGKYHLYKKVLKKCVSNVIKAYKELEEENKDLKNLENKKLWISPCYVAQKYIPVSLVEEKIEELNNSIDLAIDNSKGGLDEEFIEKGSELLAQKKVLQELLEKRK